MLNIWNLGEGTRLFTKDVKTWREISNHLDEIRKMFPLEDFIVIRRDEEDGNYYSVN